MHGHMDLLLVCFSMHGIKRVGMLTKHTWPKRVISWRTMAMVSSICHLCAAIRLSSSSRILQHHQAGAHQYCLQDNQPSLLHMHALCRPTELHQAQV